MHHLKSNIEINSFELLGTKRTKKRFNETHTVGLRVIIVEEHLFCMSNI